MQCVCVYVCRVKTMGWPEAAQVGAFLEEKCATIFLCVCVCVEMQKRNMEKKKEKLC